MNEPDSEPVSEPLKDEFGPLTLPGIFVSPTEPEALKAMGKVGWLPEKFGCDVLWMHGGSRYGVQRKEWTDLLDSTDDGRLGKEVGQMASASVRGVLVIEGSVRWTSEGQIVTGYGRPWTREQWFGVQLGVQLEGVWVVHTASLADTIAFVREFNLWTKKQSHGSLAARPGPKGLWGTKATDRDWAKHLLTGFPGIGPGVADRIYEHFGRAPLKWDCEKEDLEAVKGLSPKKVASIWGSLNG
jgi:ERCC4-type nuclease